MNRYYIKTIGDRIVLFDRSAVVPDRPIYETTVDNESKMLADCAKLNNAETIRRAILLGD